MILVIIAFGFIVFVHEASHFIVAKRMGVAVEVFSIGFGPKIFSFKSSGTEYKISLIPLGGYTSALMLGLVALFMGVESIERFLNPTKIDFSVAIWVSIIGLGPQT